MTSRVATVRVRVIFILKRAELLVAKSVMAIPETLSRPNPQLLNHSLSEEAMKALWKEIESVHKQADGVFSDG